MKTRIKIWFLLPALIAGLDLIMTGQATAQTFSTLHKFDDSDGASPFAPLILSGNTLYGTASGGGNPGGINVNGSGALFALNTGGGGFTNVYIFSYDGSPDYTNGDGASPEGDLVLSGNTLYGTTFAGGTNGVGTVFAFNLISSNFTVLHTFTGGNDGGGPYGGLILSNNTLFGTTVYGGISNDGTVFALSTSGMVFTNLHTFTNGTDGVGPSGDLLLLSNMLYGTTSGGNSGGFGSVYAVGTNGTGFTNLHNFSADSGFPTYTNSDGSKPAAGLILSSNTLYGTASASGLHSSGAIFAININGKGFTNLYNFTTNSGSPGTNSDGANPRAALVISGNTLYGTTYDGGASSSGTIFAINTNGLGFTNLYNFTYNSTDPYTNGDGAHPSAGLILANNTLYGTATGGGNQGNPESFTGAGTVFSLSLPAGPKLAIIQSGTNVILTWPTNATGFTLQSITNVISTNWSTVSPLPVTIGGQNTVTNAITGAKKFYRLSQ